MGCFCIHSMHWGCAPSCTFIMKFMAIYVCVCAHTYGSLLWFYCSLSFGLTKFSMIPRTGRPNTRKEQFIRSFFFWSICLCVHVPVPVYMSVCVCVCVSAYGSLLWSLLFPLSLVNNIFNHPPKKVAWQSSVWEGNILVGVILVFCLSTYESTSML